MVDAMMYYGFLEEARAGITTLLNPAGNLDRSIKGYQYRNGMAQYYAGNHARLSGDLAWLRSVSTQLINSSIGIGSMPPKCTTGCVEVDLTLTGK